MVVVPAGAVADNDFGHSLFVSSSPAAGADALRYAPLPSLSNALRG